MKKTIAGLVAAAALLTSPAALAQNSGVVGVEADETEFTPYLTGTLPGAGNRQQPFVIHLLNGHQSTVYDFFARAQDMRTPITTARVFYDDDTQTLITRNSTDATPALENYLRDNIALMLQNPTIDGMTAGTEIITGNYQKLMIFGCARRPQPAGATSSNVEFYCAIVAEGENHGPRPN